VCGFWGAGQGVTTRNGHSIPRSCNAALCRKKRAIHPVAQAHPKGEAQMVQKVFVDHHAKMKNEWSTAGFRILAHSHPKLRGDQWMHKLVRIAA
jgi:hypothetical protein